MTRSIVYLAAVAASGIATFSTPARAQSISTVGTLMTFGGGPIRNTNPIQLTDLCVHAVSTTTPGPLESKACNGSANQQWSAVYLGGQGYRFALESNPSLCLAVPSGYQGASSTPVTTMTCASGVAEETWIFGSGGQIAWAFIPTRCLDVLGANQSSGAEMDVTECNATTAQNFWPAGMAVSFFATNSSEANVLDVFADDDTPGQTPLDTYTYGSSNPAQKFTLTSSHQIVHTGRDGVTGCVDMLTFGGNGDGSPDNGNVRMNTCSNSRTQQWYFTNSSTDLQNPAGHVLNLAPAPSGDLECLDIDGDNSSPGAVIDTYDCNGTTAQTWDIVIAQSSPL